MNNYCTCFECFPEDVESQHFTTWPEVVVRISVNTPGVTLHAIPPDCEGQSRFVVDFPKGYNIVLGVKTLSIQLERNLHGGGGGSSCSGDAMRLLMVALSDEELQSVGFEEKRILK